MKTPSTSAFPKLLPQSREYQDYILQRLEGLRKRGVNAIVELDCGLGKRFLMWRLLQNKARTIVLLDSSSSLADTEGYLRSLGHGDHFDVISSRTPSRLRGHLLRGKKHILAMPQTLENVFRKEPELAASFEVVIINEVDKIAKRVTQRNVLRVPWNRLLPRFANSFIIGMSGTLRDSQVILDGEQARLRAELQTIKETIPRSELISMDEYFDSDIGQYIQHTYVDIVTVKDPLVSELAEQLSEQLKELQELMIQDLKESEPDLYAEHKGNAKYLLMHMPIREDLKAKYMQISLLRKNLYAMPFASFAKHAVRAGYKIAEFSETNAKIEQIKRIAAENKKTVVLCSFLDTVGLIEQELTKNGIKTFVMTGRTPMHRRGEVLEGFRNEVQQSALVLSPVGERDIDLPEADMLIVYDLVNSIKTVYQKIKRTRGGNVILLAFAETSETKKVERVLKELLVKYPWSTTEKRE